MSPLGLRRYRAERLLREEFLGLRSKVLAIVRSQLRAKGVALDRADLESCYAQAWHGLYATMLGGEQIENPSAWLVLVTFRRAIDESRSAARAKLGGESRAALEADRAPKQRAAQAGAGAPLGREWHGGVSDPDLAAELDDRARLWQVFEGLRSRLSARECEAASLCYLQGLSRAEAAERMGIGEARMRKLMEGAGRGRIGVASKVAELLATIAAGGWCEQQSSLMRAYAFGILDPDGERHDLAAAHCRECPACRAHVASLRGLAAVLPPLPLSLALAGGTGAAAGAGAGTSTAAGAGSGAGTSAGTSAGTGAGSGMGAGTGTTASAGSGAGTAAGAGWIGGAGSLAAKLAVTGLLVLGGGYAVLGGRAHGSLGGPAHSSALPSPAIAGDALAQALFPVSRTRARAHARGGRSGRGSTGSTAARARVARTGSQRGAHSTAEAPPREFTPERVHGEAPAVHPAQPSAASPPPTSSPVGSSPATGEFGFE